jgi:hypothetical protein
MQQQLAAAAVPLSKLSTQRVCGPTPTCVGGCDVTCCLGVILSTTKCLGLGQTRCAQGIHWSCGAHTAVLIVPLTLVAAADSLWSASPIRQHWHRLSKHVHVHAARQGLCACCLTSGAAMHGADVALSTRGLQLPLLDVHVGVLSDVCSQCSCRKVLWRAWRTAVGVLHTAWGHC